MDIIKDLLKDIPLPRMVKIRQVFPAPRAADVEGALRRTGQPFVANDCALSDGASPAIWLLTGPNMAGKSTFLRQNALIALLAQAGSFVPAARAHIGLVSQIFSRVGAADDLARGRSTFMVEMVETAAILNQADDRALVILDEIGRGTATFDGLSIAWAALEYLHEENRCRALFATHYHELNALTGTLASLAARTMAVKEWKGEIIFLHDVVKGAADRSYGIQAAKLAGLPQPVIARAFEVLKHLEQQRDEKPAGHFADDLPLFSVRAMAPPAAERAPDALRLRLAGLEGADVDHRQVARHSQASFAGGGEHAERHLVGGGEDRRGRLGPVEQFERAGVEAETFLLLPAPLKWRDPALGPLRPVTRVKLGTSHRLGTQPYTQPIDAGRQGDTVHLSGGIKIALAECQRLAPGGRKTRQFDPESGIDIVQPRGEQADQVCRVAAGLGQFELTDQHFAIDFPQGQLDPPRALSCTFEYAHQILGQVFHHAVEQAAVTDRFNQAALGHRRGPGHDRQQGFGHPAEQLIEPHQRVGSGCTDGAEPPRQRIARNPRKLTHALQPQPAQHQLDRWIEPQGGNG